MTLYETFFQSCSKGQLIELAFGEKHPKGIDSALPVNWVNAMRELHPDFNPAFWAFDRNAWRPVELLPKALARFQSFDDLQRLKAIRDEMNANFFEDVNELDKRIEEIKAWPNE